MLTMFKHKNNLPAYSKTTIIFGYSLFCLIVISFLVSTAIPFSFTLQYPGARHFNIIVMVLVFGISTILPALASYFIADKATHSKNKPLHHYNGVLFGIAAYWAVMLLGWLGFDSIFSVNEAPFPAPMVVSNVIPVVVTIILMAATALLYARKKTNKTSVLYYPPFQVILIISAVGAFIYPYVIGFFEVNFTILSLALFLIPLIATLIAYIVLGRLQEPRLARLCEGVIAMSIGWVSMVLADSFIALMQLPYQVGGSISYTIGLIVFVTYLYLRTRKPR